jgi:hypothetical protein
LWQRWSLNACFSADAGSSFANAILNGLAEATADGGHGRSSGAAHAVTAAYSSSVMIDGRHVVNMPQRFAEKAACPEPIHASDSSKLNACCPQPKNL